MKAKKEKEGDRRQKENSLVERERKEAPISNFLRLVLVPRCQERDRKSTKNEEIAQRSFR